MRPKATIRPEILAIAGGLPRKQGLRVIKEFALLQAAAAYLGQALDEFAYEVARRATLEVDGPDAEPWQAFADVFAEWAEVS